MTLIVIDSIRYNLFFSYNVSAVVFIKSIEIYFPLCAVESSPRLYGDWGTLYQVMIELTNRN